MSVNKQFVFIYHCLKCKKWYALNYGDTISIVCNHCGSKEREHTASVDPAIIIERFLNRDKNVMKDMKGKKK